MKKQNPLVGIIMGSKNDWKVMKDAAKILKILKIDYEVFVKSAHRTPDEMFKYAENAKGKNLEVIIAGAGGAAHLPGMTASKTVLPVIGVPVKTKHLIGLDSLLSIVQMPKGIPVATVAIDNSFNAGLLAARILGIKYPEIQTRLELYRKKIKAQVNKVKLR